MTDGTLFTGKTVEDAVADGLRSLGLTQEQAEIEVISRGSRGLFGIGSEPAQVRITPRTSKSPAQGAATAACTRNAGSHLRLASRLRSATASSGCRQPQLRPANLGVRCSAGTEDARQLRPPMSLPQTRSEHQCTASARDETAGGRA